MEDNVLLDSKDNSRVSFWCLGACGQWFWHLGLCLGENLNLKPDPETQPQILTPKTQPPRNPIPKPNSKIGPLIPTMKLSSKPDHETQP